MTTTHVAAVSMNGFLGEPEKVLNSINAWCEKVAAAGGELVLFPELVVHGHARRTPGIWPSRCRTARASPLDGDRKTTQPDRVRRNE